MVFARKAHPVIYDRLMDEARLANAEPFEVHHYLSSEEAVRLVGENFGVAFVSERNRGAIQRSRHSCTATVQPIITNSLLDPVLHSDQSSRLVNEFGRAFLKKVLPNNKPEALSGQLLLRL